MTARLLCVLVAACTLFTAACRPGDTVADADEATTTPAGDGVTATARAEATGETAVPATSMPAPATPTAAATFASGDGAADAAVTFVDAAEAADGTWTFRVTVSHPDTGWEDYADGWDVVTPDGTVLKPNPDDAFTRVLLHPHENEQPFTRSQQGIAIPEGVTTVTVRAHDSVDGFGGREVQVDLDADSGPNFEVERQP